MDGERLCLYCGGKIVGRNRKAKYCSGACGQRFQRAKAKAERESTHCLQCGVEVAHGRKYCSRAHGTAHRNGRMAPEEWVASEPRCTECGADVSDRRVNTGRCSVECHSRYTHRRWYATDRGREWSAEYGRRRLETHREEMLRYRREYYRRNREATLAVNKKWRDSHPENRRLDSARRRAMVRDATVFEVTNQDLAAILRSNDGMCVYCNAQAIEHLDHVVPLARGGSNSVGNLVGACGICNMSKGKKLLIEWKRDKFVDGR